MYFNLDPFMTLGSFRFLTALRLGLPASIVVNQVAYILGYTDDDYVSVILDTLFWQLRREDFSFQKNYNVIAVNLLYS